MQAITLSRRTAGGIPPVSLEPAVPALIALAMMICVAAILLGWFTDNLIAAGCIGLGSSFVSATTRRVTAARILAAIPLIVALAALMQVWIHLPLVIERSLLSANILHQPIINPGKPRVIPAITMLLLTLASLAMTSRSFALKSLITWLASLALSISIISGMLLLLGVSFPGAGMRSALMSLPTAATLIIISVAVIVAHIRHMIWSGNLYNRPWGRTLPGILALCILLPIISALWQLWAYKNGQITSEMAEIVQAVVQISTSCAVIAWGWFLIGRESSERWAFSTAMDSTPVAITDIDGRIIRWSKGCEQLYGWTGVEAHGQIKHQLTDAFPCTGARNTLVPDAPQEAEITEYRRDGTRLRILETRRIVQLGSDWAPIVVLSMKDITARQHAEQAMLASEARLAFAADLHELGLFEWAAATDKMQLSSHAKRLFRLQPGAFTGGLEDWRAHIRHHFGTDIVPDEPPAALNNRRYAFRLRSVHGDQPLIVEGTIFFHNLSDDQGMSMLGIIMDTTERERQTEKLRAQEFELRSILETMPEAMITVDETGRVRSFSTAAEKLFGYATEEITGRDIRMLLPGYIEAAAEATSSQASSPKITEGRDQEGNAIPVELVVGETTIGNAHISIAFVRSLREQISTQVRLNELREQLLHVSRVSAMGEMGAGLAHELNQPLTATTNFLGAAHMRLGMGASTDQVRKLVELANIEVLRAGEIIRRMRAFVAKGELDIRALPLNELIADALQLTWSETRTAGVHLRHEPSPSAPVVLADHIQIQQVLVNIINNAVKAFVDQRTEKPEIMISTVEQPNGNVMTRLLDNGPGFPSSIIGRAFEPFVSTRVNGLGLGLSICRRIVEGHGGTLAFANGLEGGAVVEFTLPIYRDRDMKAAG